MQDGRKFTSAARINIGRTPNDNRSNRQAANQSRGYISNPLRFEFLVIGRNSFKRIQFIDRLNT